MADYVIPIDWKFYGSNNGNQKMFQLPGHTVTAPRLAIFERKVPVLVDGVTTNPSYRIRVVEGELDSLGLPLPSRTTIDVNVKFDFRASATKVDADVAVLGVLFSSPDFRQDMIVEQRLPS